MYITGQFYNLGERLHSTPTGKNDILIYSGEALYYGNLLTTGVKLNLNREFQKKLYNVCNINYTGKIFPI